MEEASQREQRNDNEGVLIVVLVLLVLLTLGLGLFFWLDQKNNQDNDNEQVIVKKPSVTAQTVSLSKFRSTYSTKKSSDDFIIVDLRGGDTWHKGHIPGSIPLTVDYVNKFQNKNRLDAYKTIGVVSDQAAEVTECLSKMKKMAWKNDKGILGLQVSIAKWQEEGYQWEKFEDKP